MKSVESNEEFLRNEPTTTSEFVEYLKFIEEITLQIDQMESDLDYAKELYDICDEYKILIPFEDTDNYLNAGSIINNLRALADKKIEEKWAIVDLLGESVGRDIESLLDEVANFQKDLQVNILFERCRRKKERL